MLLDMDGDIQDPDFQEVHPESLNEKSPASLTSIISLAADTFSAYGWIILFISIICWIAWKSSRDKYEAWRESAEYHKNPDKFIVRENSLQAARQKMQEEYERKAREHAMKLKEKEEERRANSATCSGASSSKENSINSDSKPKKPIKSFRPEFNPLMSDTRSCRPSFGRRRGGG